MCDWVCKQNEAVNTQWLVDEGTSTAAWLS